MFGGTGEDSYVYLNDLWSIPLSGGPKWIEIAPEGPTPAPRINFAMVYDSRRHRLILYGGRITPGPTGTPSIVSGDTWTLSLAAGSKWTQVDSPTGPSPGPRTAHEAVYDSVRDQLIVVGGENESGGRAFDVWALDLSGAGGWSMLTSWAGEFISDGVVLDTARQRLVAIDRKFSGSHDLWELDLERPQRWTRLPNYSPMPARSDFTISYDPIGDRAVLVGGFYRNGGGGANAVWQHSFRDSAWSEITAGSEPGRHNLGSSAYDPLRHRIILSGGTWENHAVWAFSLAAGGGWGELISDSQPRMRFGHVGIYDPVGEKLVIFGGWPGPFSDVWALSLGDDPQWTSLSTVGAPEISVTDITGVLDTRRHRLLVYAENPRRVWALDLGPPNNWSMIEPVNTPPDDRVGDHVGIYDPVRDRLIVFGHETWALNLSGAVTWAKLETRGETPPRLWNAAAIYDPMRDRMIVYGGWASGTTGRTWSLTLSDPPEWSLLAEPASTALEREGHSAIYDPIRDRMVVYAGYNSREGSQRLDTWALDLAGTPAWHELTQVERPTMRRWDHVSVYDSKYDRMIVCSGYDTKSNWALEWGVPPLEVEVEVQPGLALNPAAFRSKGLIAAVVFGAPHVNVMDLDLETARLGGAGIAINGAGIRMSEFKLVNDDPWDDFEFRVRADEVKLENTEQELKFEALNSTAKCNSN